MFIVVGESHHMGASARKNRCNRCTGFGINDRDPAIGQIGHPELFPVSAEGQIVRPIIQRLDIPDDLIRVSIKDRHGIGAFIGRIDPGV